VSPVTSSRVTVDPVAADTSSHLAGAVGDVALVAVGIPVYRSDTGPSLVDGLDDDTLISLLSPPGDAAGRPIWDLSLFERRGFRAEPGQSVDVVRAASLPELVFLGCGRASEVSTDELRRAGAVFVRRAGRSGKAAFLLPGALAERAAPDRPSEQARADAVQAVTEGTVLGSYRFTAFKGEADRTFVERVSVVGLGIDASVLEEGVARGTRVAEAVCLVRDMVNEPPSSMTPTRVAGLVQDLAGTKPGTSVEVWEPERISGEGLGGLMGVARGSTEPPKLVRVEYRPPGAAEADGRIPHIVLVGKGITFDSGGLSLKTSEGMSTMKTDMSGAATVLATVAACADLGVQLRVSAIAPLTENMPDGRATKPGDVLRIRDGQTIEVLNTDAEGRLVLADALVLAAELEPDAIVDLATLTGASVVSLGASIAALFANDDELADRVLAASRRAGEPMWRLPLASQYGNHVESDVADMKNIGKPGEAGAIVAALILERFVKDVPWVHLDMAGPARSDQDEGALTKGGTGFGVRTLLELLKDLAEAPLNRAQ
jgi:leucyl aminopeptidase